MSESEEADSSHRLRLAVVGPCSAGKSVLANALRGPEVEVRHVAQEHTIIPDLWRRLYPPDLLIYLDVSHQVALARRPHTTGEPERLERQRERLAHARQHADFYLDTSSLTPEQVIEQVEAFLQAYQQTP